MFDKKQLRIFTGSCFALFTFFALICLVKHFSFAGLLIFIGAAVMTAGAFSTALQMMLPIGFAVTALAYLVEFIWYLIQCFSKGFIWFFLLFPVLEGLLMIAVFLLLLKISMMPDASRKWGIMVTAATFASMLLIVGTAFAGHFIGEGEVNYFVFLQRLALIPAGILFGLMMEGEEPLLTIDLKKEEDETAGEGQVIGYTPDESQYRHRRPTPPPEEGEEAAEEAEATEEPEEEP